MGESGTRTNSALIERRLALSFGWTAVCSRQRAYHFHIACRNALAFRERFGTYHDVSTSYDVGGVDRDLAKVSFVYFC